MSMAQSEQFKEMMTSAEAFFALGFSRPEKLVLGDGSQAEAHIEPVNQEFFRDAGVPMLLGTDFAAASADPAATNLIVSERFWRETLGGSRSVVGSAVEFDGISYTIVGVSGGGFAGLRNGRRADAWMTLARNAATFGAPPMVPEHMRADFSQRIPSVQLYARLKPGMSIDDAQTELDALLPRFRENWRSLTQKGLVTAWVMEGNAWNPWAYQSQLRRIEMMFAGALLILIIASLNLASYFLARGVGRMQEFRTRLAIGASRSAVVRQLFLEGIVIVAGAAVLGGILNIWLSGVLLIGSDTTPAGFDWRVAVFVLAAAASLAVVASLVPALRLALKPNLAAATQSALGRQSSRWQPLLVLQVLIATLVVVAGTLFVGELVRLKHADVGFDADGLLVGELYFRTDATSVIIDHSGNRGIEADLAKRLDAVPGIESYAFGMAIPFTGRGLDAEVIAPVGTAARTEEQRRAHPNIVTSGFFETLGIPIVGGRLFDAEMPGEALVSRAIAQSI